jgi:hypothetical protein
METRIRRYFTFRKLNSKIPQAHHTTDELDLISVPYESTHNGRAPVLSSVSQPREPIMIKDDIDVLAIRAFPYASTVAGTPPVFGATPIKGNGPVKLQTSRRLSSGELLITTQDHQRTLSDIREGEYIVGRKEPKRISKTISIKLPLHSKASSPRASLALAPQLSNPSPGQSPIPEQNGFWNRVPDPITVDREPATIEIPAPETTPRSPYGQNPSATKSYGLGPTEIPLPLSPGRTPSSRASLLSKGEEQNATIQALWRAEYTRLVAIYGQDGVDRNIAELNKDRFGPSDKRFSVETSARQFSTTPQGLSPHSFDTIVPPLVSPRGSVAHDLPFVDNSSDYSSVKVPSLLSSEESSSSYTKRTSLYEADVPTTREEVSRIVENMRKNYLKALEAKVEEKPKTKRPKKSKLRASYTHTSVPAAPTGPKSSKAGRQSWHASTTQTTPKQEKQPKKRAISKPKAPRDSTIGPLKTTASKSSLKTKSQLHRADSTTLGSFFGSKKGDQNSPSPARTPKAPKVGRLASVAQVDNVRPPSASSQSSGNLAPEIDDFDIFYQDLARDSGPTANNIKPSIPAIYVPHNKEIAAGPPEAAPPPPNIDSTPRKRPGLAA